MNLVIQGINALYKLVGVLVACKLRLDPNRQQQPGLMRLSRPPLGSNKCLAPLDDNGTVNTHYCGEVPLNGSNVKFHTFYTLSSILPFRLSPFSTKKGLLWKQPIDILFHGGTLQGKTQTKVWSDNGVGFYR